MPIESAPTLAPEPQAPVSAMPLVRLERTSVAAAGAVDPLLRSARGRVASTRLRARAAERAAENAEAALAAQDPSRFEAERAARMALVAAEIEERRQERESAIAAARAEAAAVVASAEAESEAEVTAARAELQALVAAIAAAPVLASSSVPVTPHTAPGGSGTDDPRPADEPDDEPVMPPAAAYPPPGAMPFTGPATSPVPTVPPPGAPGVLPAPVVASPYAPTYSPVLIQAADGTLQQALVLNSPAPQMVPAVGAPVAQQAASSPSSALVPVTPAPAVVEPVIEGAAASVPAPPLGRRLLHLDVILPLVAVLIVLVVLLAWLG